MHQFMSGKEGAWICIVRKHGLTASRDLEATKLRDHGNDGCDSSFRRFDRQNDLLRQNRITPR